MELMQFKVMGMNKDTALSSFDNKNAYDIYNMRIVATDNQTSAALTNEKGTLLEIPLNTIKGDVIGAATLDNKIYLFTHYVAGTYKSTDVEHIEVDETQIEIDHYEDRLYEIPVSYDGKVDLDGIQSLFNYEKRQIIESHPDYIDLNVDLEHPFEILPYFESKTVKKLYWIDGKNQPRVFNVVSKNMTIDFLPEVGLGNKITVTKQAGGGEFPAGVIQYCFTMAVKNGQESNIFYTTPLYYISRDSKSGLPVGETSKCSFRIDFNEIDWKDYDYIIVYSLLRTALNGEIDCRRVGRVSPNYTPTTVYVTKTNTSEDIDYLLLAPITLDQKADEKYDKLYRAGAGWPNEDFYYYETNNPYRHYGKYDIVNHKFNKIDYDKEWFSNKRTSDYNLVSYKFSDILAKSTNTEGTTYTSTIEVQALPKQYYAILFYCSNISNNPNRTFTNYTVSIYNQSNTLIAKSIDYGYSEIAADRNYFNAINYTFNSLDYDSFILPVSEESVTYRIEIKYNIVLKYVDSEFDGIKEQFLELLVLNDAENNVASRINKVEDEEESNYAIWSFDDNNRPILNYLNLAVDGKWTPLGKRIPSLTRGHLLEEEVDNPFTADYYSQAPRVFHTPVVTQLSNYYITDFETEDYKIHVGNSGFLKKTYQVGVTTQTLEDKYNFNYVQLPEDLESSIAYKYYATYSFINEVNNKTWETNFTPTSEESLTFYTTEISINGQYLLDSSNNSLASNTSYNFDEKHHVVINVPADTSIKDTVDWNTVWKRFYYPFSINPNVQRFELRTPDTFANGKYRVTMPTYYYGNKGNDNGVNIQLFVELTSSQGATKTIRSSLMIKRTEDGKYGQIMSIIPKKSGSSVDEVWYYKGLLFSINGKTPVSFGSTEDDYSGDEYASMWFTCGRYTQTSGDGIWDTTENYVDFYLYTGRSINSADPYITDDTDAEVTWSISKIGVEYVPRNRAGYDYTIVLGDIYVTRISDLDSGIEGVRLLEDVNRATFGDASVILEDVNLDYNNTAKNPVNAAFNLYELPDNEDEKPQPTIKFDILLPDSADNQLEGGPELTKLIKDVGFNNMFFGGYYIKNSNGTVYQSDLFTGTVDDITDNGVYSMTIPIYDDTHYTWDKNSSYTITPFIVFSDEYFEKAAPDLDYAVSNLILDNIRVEDTRAVEHEPEYVYKYSPLWLFETLNILFGSVWYQYLGIATAPESKTPELWMQTHDYTAILKTSSRVLDVNWKDVYEYSWPSHIGPAPGNVNWKDVSQSGITYVATNENLFDGNNRANPLVTIYNSLEFEHSNNKVKEAFTKLYNIYLSDIKGFNELEPNTTPKPKNYSYLYLSEGGNVYIDAVGKVLNGLTLDDGETFKFYDVGTYKSSKTDRPSTTLIDSIEIKHTGVLHNFDDNYLYNVISFNNKTLPLTIQLNYLDITTEVVETKTSNNLVILDTHDSTQETVDVSHLLLTCQRNRIVPLTMENKNDTLFFGNLNINTPVVSDAIKNLISHKEAVTETDEEGVVKTTIPSSWEKEDEGDATSITINTAIKLNYRRYSDVAEAYSTAELSCLDRASGGEDGLKIFKGREYYRLGIQLLNDFGEKTDVIDLAYTKINPLMIDSAIRTYYPQYELDSKVLNALKEAGYTSARLMMEEKTYENRSVYSLGIVSPTLFQFSNRVNNAPYGMSSWFFRTINGSLPYLMYEGLKGSNDNYCEIQSLHNIDNFETVVKTLLRGTFMELSGEFGLLDAKTSLFADTAAFCGYVTIKWVSVDKTASGTYYKHEFKIPIGLPRYWDRPLSYLISTDGKTTRSWERDIRKKFNDYEWSYEETGRNKHGNMIYGMYSKSDHLDEGGLRNEHGSEMLAQIFVYLFLNHFCNKDLLREYLETLLMKGSSLLIGCDAVYYRYKLTEQTSKPETNSSAWKSLEPVAQVTCKEGTSLPDGTLDILFKWLEDYGFFSGVLSDALRNAPMLSSGFWSGLISDYLGVYYYSGGKLNINYKDTEYSCFSSGPVKEFLGTYISGYSSHISNFYVDSSLLTFHSPNVTDIKNLIANFPTLKSRIIGIVDLRDCLSSQNITLSTSPHNFKKGGQINNIVVLERELLTTYPGYKDSFSPSLISLTADQATFVSYYVIYPWHRSTSLGHLVGLYSSEVIDAMTEGKSNYAEYTKYYGTPKTKILANNRIFGVYTTFKENEKGQLDDNLLYDSVIAQTYSTLGEIIRLKEFSNYSSASPLYLGFGDLVYVKDSENTSVTNEGDTSSEDEEDKAEYPLYIYDKENAGVTGDTLRGWELWKMGRVSVDDVGEATNLLANYAGDPIQIRYTSTPHIVLQLDDTRLPNTSAVLQSANIEYNDSGRTLIGCNVIRTVKNGQKTELSNTPTLSNVPNAPYSYIMELYDTPVENNRTDSLVSWIPIGEFLNFATKRSYIIKAVKDDITLEHIALEHSALINLLGGTEENAMTEEEYNWLWQDPRYEDGGELFLDTALHTSYTKDKPVITVTDCLTPLNKKYSLVEKELAETIDGKECYNYTMVIDSNLKRALFIEFIKLLYKSFYKEEGDVTTDTNIVNSEFYEWLSTITATVGDLTTKLSELVIDVNENSISSLTLIGTEGDHFYGRYDCLKTYAYDEKDVNQVVDIVSFPVESPININARTDRNRGVLDNTLMSPKNFNIFNDVYNQSNNIFTYYNSNADENKLFSNEIIWSLTKNIMEDLDSWSSITTAAVLDLDGVRGEIHKLKCWLNNLFAFLDKAITYIPFDARALILNSQDDVPIEITNAGKVAESPVVLFDNLGCLNKWSVCVSSDYLYFVDNYNKGIYRIGGKQGVECITDAAGFHSWMVQNNVNVSWELNSLSNIKSYYEPINKEVYFTNINFCLVFNETLNMFTSFYSYNGTPWFVNVYDSLYAVRNSEKHLNTKDVTMWRLWLGEYNNFFGEYKPYSVTVIANENPLTTKIFNTVTYTADVFTLTEDSTEYTFNPELSFDVVEAEDEYLKGSYTIAKNSLSNTPPYALRKKFRVWGLNIPRDGDTVDNIGISNNTVADKMSNPWIKLTLKRTNTEEDTKVLNHRLNLHDMIIGYTVL